MRYLKEKNIYNYYMDSDSSQEIKIPEIGKINIIDNDSSSKKIESSDTDYYLGLLANKNKEIWECPSCKKTNPSSFEICWNCK